MSHKNNVHNIDSVSSQTADTMNYRHLFLFSLMVAAIITVFGLAASLRPASNVPAVNRENVVRYSSALEMQYAQSWLNAQMRETAVNHYSKPLEMSYAQPWLKAQTNETAVNRYSNVLEMPFSQPWLDKQHTEACIDRLDIIYVWRFGKRPCSP